MNCTDVNGAKSLRAALWCDYSCLLLRLCLLVFVSVVIATSRVERYEILVLVIASPHCAAINDCYYKAANHQRWSLLAALCTQIVVAKIDF